MRCLNQFLSGIIRFALLFPSCKYCKVFVNDDAGFAVLLVPIGRLRKCLQLCRR